MPVRPTLAEVRDRGQNNPHLLADPAYARLVVRRVSPFVAYAVVRFTPLSADVVTAGAIGSGILAALCLLPATPAFEIGAVLLLQLAFLLDVADGEVARARGTASRRGTYLDLIGHMFQNIALYACAGAVLVRVSGGAWWALAVALLAMGFAQPFGFYAALQVRGHGEGTGPHGGLRRSTSGGFRRVTFLWNYPASMNLFSVALFVDAVAQISGVIQAPVIIATFYALFGSALVIRHLLHALRLLGSTDWTT